MLDSEKDDDSSPYKTRVFMLPWDATFEDRETIRRLFTRPHYPDGTNAGEQAEASRYTQATKAAPPIVGEAMSIRTVPLPAPKKAPVKKGKPKLRLVPSRNKKGK